MDRSNAQFGTGAGPRTEEGKTRSAQNARKHGLTAWQLLITSEEREEFELLLARYQNEIHPPSQLQQTLFDELVNAAWNLRRVRILQAETDLLDPRRSGSKTQSSPASPSRRRTWHSTLHAASLHPGNSSPA